MESVSVRSKGRRGLDLESRRRHVAVDPDGLCDRRQIDLGSFMNQVAFAGELEEFRQHLFHAIGGVVDRVEML